MGLDSTTRRHIIQTAEMYQTPVQQLVAPASYLPAELLVAARGQASALGKTTSGKTVARKYISELSSDERKCLLENLNPPKSGILKHDKFLPALKQKMEEIGKEGYQPKNKGMSARISRKTQNILGIRPTTDKVLKEICRTAPLYIAEEDVGLLHDFVVSNKRNKALFESFKNDTRFEVPFDFSDEYETLRIPEGSSLEKIEKAYIKEYAKAGKKGESSEELTKAFKSLVVFKSIEENLFPDADEPKTLKTAFENYEKISKDEASTDARHLFRSDLYKLTEIAKTQALDEPERI